MLDTERIAYSCPRCGWIRIVSADTEWLGRLIDHPLYGLVRQERMAAIDIVNHKFNNGCDAYMKRIAALQKADKTRETLAA